MDRAFSGIIFHGEKPEIIEGTIFVNEKNIIYDIKKRKINSKYWIVPKFINCHTHIGDSIIKDPPFSQYNNYEYEVNLDYLIKPPSGFKQQILKKKKEINLIKYINNSLVEIYNNGCITCVDFREGGVKGINLIKNAKKLDSKKKIDPIILSRPQGLINNYTTSKEIKEILSLSHGFGISGYNDISEELIFSLTKYSKRLGKIIGIHAGEKNRTDIRRSIDLNPNLLIHMTNSNESDLRIVKDKNIPIVVCPRSNILTKVGFPPIKKMIAHEIPITIGTDNIMLNSPNMFEEIHLLYKLFNINENTIYKIITKNSTECLGLNSSIIKVGNKANFMVLNSESYNLSGVFNPLSGFIRRARVDDIIKII